MKDPKLRLYFLLALFPSLMSASTPPTTAWAWMLWAFGGIYQGLLAVKAYGSEPSTPLNPPTIPVKTILILLAAALAASTVHAEPHHFTPKKHYALGWTSGPKTELRQMVHAPFYRKAMVQPIIDLSGVMPGVTANALTFNNDAIYSQLQEGSCTAHGGKRVFEFAWHKMFGAFLGASRQGLYIRSLVHDGNWPNDAGSTTGTVIWVLQNEGIGTETCCPYSIPLASGVPACYLPEAKNHVVVHAYDVDNTDGVSIQVALSNGYPVLFGGLVYAAIEDLTSDDYFEPPPAGNPIGGHERVILGINTTMTHTFQVKTGGFFGRTKSVTYTGFAWVANSWDTTWGYQGYSWIPLAVISDPHINNDFAVVDIVQDNSTSTH